MILRTVRAPTREEFAALVARRQPVLITGASENWPALTRWPSVEYLRSRVGRQVVPVEVYPGGDTGRHAEYVSRRMLVNDFLDRLHDRVDRPAHYLIAPLRLHLPALLDDIVTPAFLTEIGRVILMLGYHTFSNLHFHPFQDALVCQVVGKKRFGLYPPEETHNLYPRPWLSKWFEFTRIDRFNPVDLGRYPRVRRARGVEVTLEPGTMLFIPRHWWHWAGTSELAAHILYYFGEKHPLGWAWTDPGRRSLFWLGRYFATEAVVRARRRIEARLGMPPPPPANGDEPPR